MLVTMLVQGKVHGGHTTFTDDLFLGQVVQYREATSG
jgi:hypothetical protein